MTASLSSIPYSDRRLITVSVPRSAPGLPGTKSAFERAASSAAKGAAFGLAGVVVMAAIGLAATPDQPEGEKGALLPVLAVSPEQAAGLSLPPGHPRDKVVYAAHPLDAHIYIPTFDFHRYLFDHKVSEAMRLLRSLGAVTIAVDRIEGWDQSAGVSAGGTVPSAPGVTARTSAGRMKKSNSSIMSRMKLNPSGPALMPTDLVWTPHEPLWQEVASARLESGLTEFSLDVKSTDDFGINAEVKVAVEKMGLNLGGNFKRHESTTWRLAGKFAKANE